MARKRATRLPTQGKRSGVTVDRDAESSQMESIDNFFNQARSPEEKKDDDVSSKVPDNANGRPKRMTKGPKRMAEPKMRLSLPGQNPADDASSTTSTCSSTGGKQSIQRNRKVLGMPSPSELSKVSTMPPTPGTSLHDQLFTQEEVDVPRHAANEEDAQERPAAIQDQKKSQDFPTQDDDTKSENDGDGDDLAPPVMEEDDIDQQSPLPAPQLPEDSESQKSPTPVTLPQNSLSDTDSDDDEGPGFNMVQDPETPQEKREQKSQQRSRGRKKKTMNLRGSIESDDKTSQRKAKNRTKRRVVFSPKGIPIRNRDYDRIPIVEPSPDDGGGLRRSKRAKTAPLEFWRNEKVEYGPIEDDNLVEEIGDMPVPKAVIRALDTPYRKRKEPSRPKLLSKGNSKPTQRTPRDHEADEEQPFDSSKLKRKYKNNLLEGEIANVWDDGNDDLNELKVVAYADQMEAAELPLIAKRTESEGNVVGKAAQAFNVPSDENDNYVGYIMGNLLLPPRGIKDAESVGPCSQTFTVVTGQKKALEVAFADPDGPEGLLEEDSAQRFLLSPGDLFRVPPGNTYRLQNHSRTKSCLLTWTIIRPRNVPSASDDE